VIFKIKYKKRRREEKRRGEERREEKRRGEQRRWRKHLFGTLRLMCLYFLVMFGRGKRSF
jgi:hypothetical protein